jgi:two-component system, NarL family, response regulator NreC
MSIRVLLADDHQLMREGLRAILKLHQDLEVIGEAEDGLAALALAAERHPDVVVMDIAMPRMNGIEATKRLLESNPQLKIVVLSMHGNRQVVLEALKAGAKAYLLKDCSQHDLARAIRTVHSNLTFLSPEIASHVMEGEAGLANNALAKIPVLSRRERQILELVATGQSSSQIALELNICSRSVSNCRRRLMRKLGMASVAELTKYAIRTGLTGLDA